MEGTKKAMILRDVRDVLDAEVLCGEHLLDCEVKTGFACDLISEMLAHAGSYTLLITSLTNAHVIHTAEIMDAVAVVFAGGKRPDRAMIERVNSGCIPLLTTEHLIFKCCGLLFQHGIEAGDRGLLQ